MYDYTNIDFNQGEIFGKMGTGPGEFHCPHSIIINQDNILISELQGCRISVMTENFEHIKFIGDGKGSKDGQLFFPHGLTVTNNRLVVCDNGNSRLQLFDVDTGQFLSKILFSHGEYPRFITIDSNDQLFVSMLNKIVILSSTGKCTGSIRNNKCDRITGLSFNSHGNLLACCDQNISMFDHANNDIYTRNIGYSNDYSLIVDSYDRIIVSGYDRSHVCLEMYHADFELIHSHWTNIRGGICIDEHNDNLLICDRHKSNVKRIKLSNIIDK